MFVTRRYFKNAVDKLQKRIEALEFQRDNPDGLVFYRKFGSFGIVEYALEYVKDSEVKRFVLPYISLMSGCWLIRKDNTLILKKFGNKEETYRFDTQNEILIKIENKVKEKNK